MKHLKRYKRLMNSFLILTMSKLYWENTFLIIKDLERSVPERSYIKKCYYEIITLTKNKINIFI